MPKTKYVISLFADEEQSLNNITHKGSGHTARKTRMHKSFCTAISLI